MKKDFNAMLPKVFTIFAVLQSFAQGSAISAQQNRHVVLEGMPIQDTCNEGEGTCSNLGFIPVETLQAAERFHIDTDAEPLISTQDLVVDRLKTAFLDNNYEAVERMLDDLKETPNLLTPQLFRDILMENNNRGVSIFHAFIFENNIDMIKLIVNRLKNSPEHLRDVFMQRDKSERSLLNRAMYHKLYDLIKLILNTIEDSPELCDVLMQEFIRSSNFNHLFKENTHNFFNIILNNIKNNEILLREAFSKVNVNGDSIFHLAIEQASESLITMMLNTIKGSPAFLQEVLLKENRQGYRILDYAFIGQKNHVFEQILNSIQGNRGLLREVLWDSSGNFIYSNIERYYNENIKKHPRRHIKYAQLHHPRRARAYERRNFVIDNFPAPGISLFRSRDRSNGGDNNNLIHIYRIIKEVPSLYEDFFISLPFTKFDLVSNGSIEFLNKCYIKYNLYINFIFISTFSVYLLCGKAVDYLNKILKCYPELKCNLAQNNQQDAKAFNFPITIHYTDDKGSNNEVQINECSNVNKNQEKQLLFQDSISLENIRKFPAILLPSNSRLSIPCVYEVESIFQYLKLDVIQGSNIKNPITRKYNPVYLLKQDEEEPNRFFADQISPEAIFRNEFDENSINLFRNYRTAMATSISASTFLCGMSYIFVSSLQLSTASAITPFIAFTTFRQLIQHEYLIHFIYNHVPSMKRHAVEYIEDSITRYN